MATNDLSSQQFYHGTKASLKPGDTIESCNFPTTYVYLTPNLDAAIWEAELAVGEGLGRVYIVEPLGQIEDAPELTDRKAPKHLSMSYRSREPLRVTGEVTEWTLYHGTRAELPSKLLSQLKIHANFIALRSRP